MNLTFELVNRFLALFDGNREAVGTEEGGCRRLADPNDWELELEGHLRFPDCTVGVYPMVQEGDIWSVCWGCVDFDEGEEPSRLDALDLYNCLHQFGVTSWVERSRSKGYHVWIFLEDWADADVVRRALLAACQIVSVPTKEINPKQSALQAGQLGNYVRLPYPGALNGPIYPDPEDGLHRRVMVDVETGQPMSLRWFVDSASNNLVPQSRLEELARYYLPPQTGVVKRTWGALLSGSAVDRLRGKARIIWEQGPLEHPDSDTNYRGHTLWKLARLLKEDGQHTPEEALELLMDADDRWGKFQERPDGGKYLTEMAHKAFGL